MYTENNFVGSWISTVESELQGQEIYVEIPPTADEDQVQRESNWRK